MDSYSVSNYKDSQVISGISPSLMASKMFVVSPYFCFSMSSSGQAPVREIIQALSLHALGKQTLKPGCSVLSSLTEIGGNSFHLKLFSNSILSLALRDRGSQIPFEKLTILCFIQNGLSCIKKAIFLGSD